jgi:uncharacterized membrane protein
MLLRVSDVAGDPTDEIDPQVRLGLRRRFQILLTAVLIAIAADLHFVDEVSWLVTLLAFAGAEVVAVVSAPLLLSKALNSTKQ